MPVLKPTVSVVVPVYNSEATVAKLIERLEPVLNDIASKFEVILVDDASRDGSWSQVADLATKHAWVRGTQLTRNFGQHNALLCGVRLASYDVIITIDDDLQHPPEEIPKLLAKLEGGLDLVYGSPAILQHGFMRDLASQITKIALQGSMGGDIARHVGAFRAFRAQLRNAFEAYRGTFVSMDVLLSWSTSRVGWVEVRHDARQSGTSNYTVGKLLRHGLNMITGFSTWPLQLASLTGFGIMFAGIAILIFVLINYVRTGGSVPGVSFLASTIAIFSGAQLFALGIIGEYLARIHLRSMDRPPYVIRVQTDNERASA